MTKNVGDVGARSEQGRNIVTVTKNVGDLGAGSEICRSNVTVTKNLGAGRSRVGARSEQNMIHDNHGCTLCSVFHACLHLPDVRFNPHCLSFSSSLSKLSSCRHCCVVVVAVEDIAMSSCNTNCDKYNLSDKKSEHYSLSNSFATRER